MYKKRLRADNTGEDTDGRFDLYRESNRVGGGGGCGDDDEDDDARGIFCTFFDWGRRERAVTAGSSFAVACRVRAKQRTNP